MHDNDFNKFDTQNDFDNYAKIDSKSLNVNSEYNSNKTYFSNDTIDKHNNKWIFYIIEQAYPFIMLGKLNPKLWNL